MRWLFTTSFPDGWPGIGLLLLRCSLVVELIEEILARLSVTGSAPAIIHLLDVAALLVAASLCLGFLTPLAALAGGIFTAVALPLPAGNCYLFGNWRFAHVAAFAISIVLVGPGAYSIDCRLFGRREIIVPRISSSESDQ